MHISCVGDVRRAQLHMSEYHRAHHSSKGWDRTEQWDLRATTISCWMLTWEFKVFFSSFPVTTVPLPIIGAVLDLLANACRTHRWVTCNLGLAHWVFCLPTKDIQDHPTPVMIRGVYFQIYEINMFDLAKPKNRIYAQWIEGNGNSITIFLAEAL